jgi:DNA-binding NtrC family response regulator
MSGEIMSLEEMEREYIKRVLEVCDGNKKKAAEILGIDRKTIYRKLGSK